MHSFYQQIYAHKSIRKYKSDPIAPEVMQRILNAGLRASSSGNMQAYSIILTESPKIKEQLYPLHFKQDMAIQAPAILTFCSDFNRMRKWLALNNAPENFDNFMSFLIGMIDATLASQNVALAAEAEGLGLCYMGTTLASCQKISKVLKLPKQVVPVVGFCIGHPDETPEHRDRLPLDGLIHQDVYHDYSNRKIKDTYAQREKEAMQRYRLNPEFKKKIKESHVENLAQIYTKLKYTKESHLEYSNSVMACLEEQGFLS